MKHILTAVLSVALAATTLLAQKGPTSVIHVINVKWTADATPEKIKAVLDFAHTLPGKKVGVTRVWTKNIKYQGQEDFKQAIVMEFESHGELVVQIMGSRNVSEGCGYCHGVEIAL